MNSFRTETPCGSAPFLSITASSHQNPELVDYQQPLLSVAAMLNRGYGRGIVASIITGGGSQWDHVDSKSAQPGATPGLPAMHLSPDISRWAGPGQALEIRLLIFQPYFMDNEVKCDCELDNNPVLSPSRAGCG